MGTGPFNWFAIPVMFKFSPHPLPYEDIMDDGTATEHNSETNDNWSHNSWRLVEMQKSEENNSCKI